MTSLVLTDVNGNIVCELPDSLESLIADAEENARRSNGTKRRCLEQAVTIRVASDGYTLRQEHMKDAMRAIDEIRAGKSIEQLLVVVDVTVQQRLPKAKRKPISANRVQEPEMAQSTANSKFRFFESERIYPDPKAEEWFARLVGIDGHKDTLLLELELLVKPDLISKWSQRHHRGILAACKIMTTRAPLIVLEGDVGCGKTVLAESVGDPLARRLNCHVHMLKINTQVRGTGMVGEMTDLIAQAFTAVEEKAKRNSGEPVLLLIDEADSLAAKRTEQHMHHEDKAGVNTLLQRIDRLRQEGLPVCFQ